MSLGVGKSTQFSQNSNYHTSFNHSFRDESSYEPAEQRKKKCPYCGVWARKGKECSLCGTFVPGDRLATSKSFTALTESQKKYTPTGRNRGGDQSHNVSHGSHQRPASFVRSREVSLTTSPGRQQPSHQQLDGDESLVSRRYHMASSASQFNGSASSERGSSASSPSSSKGKIKCTYCGIWVQIGKYCCLCRTLAK